MHARSPTGTTGAVGPEADFPGRPPHSIPFSLETRGAAVYAVLASGDRFNLTTNVPRMAQLALRASQPGVSMAATLRESGQTFTTAERQAVMDAARRILTRYEADERRFASLLEAARILGVPISHLREFLRTEDGRRALGYPIVIGDEIRIPMAALEPETRTRFLESVAK